MKTKKTMKKIKKTNFKVPWLELIVLIVFIGLIIYNFQFLTFPAGGNTYGAEDLILVYPWFMNYLFVSCAMISLVAIIKGGYGNLKRPDEEGLIFGLFEGLIVGLIYGGFYGLVWGLIYGLIYGLIVGLIFGLIVSFLFNLLKEFEVIENDKD